MNCEIKKVQKGNPYKPGDKVRYKDNDPHLYTVYAIYSPTQLSIGLRDYPRVSKNAILGPNSLPGFWIQDVKAISLLPGGPVFPRQ